MIMQSMCKKPQRTWPANMANLLKLDREDGHGALRKYRKQFKTTKKPYTDGTDLIGPRGKTEEE